MNNLWLFVWLILSILRAVDDYDRSKKRSKRKRGRSKRPAALSRDELEAAQNRAENLRSNRSNAYRRRMRAERERRRQERLRIEAQNSEDAIQKRRQAREVAQREAIEAEYSRQDAETVIFESADDAFPEIPSVSLHEDEEMEGEAAGDA